MRGDVVSGWTDGGVMGRSGLAVERRCIQCLHCCITRSLCAIPHGLVEMRSWAHPFEEGESDMQCG